MRRIAPCLFVLLTAALVGLALASPAAAQAPAKVKVGVLKLTSSAPVFVGVEKGFFKDVGIEPELVFFQAAAPIATALAAGQLDVGATGLTAALYNIVLGGEQLWIVADKGREWPGYPLVAIVVQKELWDSGGLRSVKDLKGGFIIRHLSNNSQYEKDRVFHRALMECSHARWTIYLCPTVPCAKPLLHFGNVYPKQRFWENA